MIPTVKGFGIVNKAEVDVFLELSHFFDDPADVGNLISGSFACSKTSLNIDDPKYFIPLMYELLMQMHPYSISLFSGNPTWSLCFPALRMIVLPALIFSVLFAFVL